ncbi:NAD(P)H quinone oxidoreductase [Sediminivirga luteola]|uniref:NAD(P)H quinone oxidoreductase n=2 Tax=Sediminivirga luteola TaxID=1774748 RepID=A0A8J2TXI1_9MICO|nr:NAD(P)H quinone oxidoreductase [Sediminivirga luteola]
MGTMKAITIRKPGGPEELVLGEVPDVQPGPGEVLIRVRACGVNRADLLQRQGFYDPPPGTSEIPGLEVSGTVAALGPGADEALTSTGAPWQLGDEVCALLSGGGLAELVAVPAGQLLPVPHGIGLLEAAALPEVHATVFSNVVQQARLQPGEWLLVHGGGSGIGTAVIQLARAIGARPIVTAGSEAKLQACRELGAEAAINYREQDFVEEVRRITDGHGADVILDVIGAKYLARNLAALAADGRLAIIGLQGGTRTEIDLRTVMSGRLTVSGTTLRARPPEQKARIVAGVREQVWPFLESGAIRPVIHEVLPLAQAARAHQILESGENIGKVLLSVPERPERNEDV